MIDKYEHLEIPSDYYGGEIFPDPNECQSCGSNNTFETFDKKLVCRKCWTVGEII